MIIVKNISFYLLISIFICFLSELLNSSFLSEFLKANTIMLEIALLAMNIATLGMISSKLYEVLEKNREGNIDKTRKELNLALIEQITLIVVCFMSLIIFDNNKAINVIGLSNYREFILNVILLASLIYYLFITWDIGKSVFIIIDEINKMGKNN